MAVARKAPKGVSRNFVRLLVMTEGFLILSSFLLIDVYYIPLTRPQAVPTWAVAIALGTLVVSLALITTTLAVPSLRSQFQIIRARSRRLSRTGRTGPVVYLLLAGLWAGLGGYFLWDFPSMISVARFSSVTHYLALLAFAIVGALLAFPYFSSLSKI